MIKNRWNNSELKKYYKNFKGLEKNFIERIYSSHLIGSDKNLVMHGGGNISFKTTEKDIFNNSIDVLRVKGSGWDLDTMTQSGLPAINLSQILELRSLDCLSDEDLVNFQRSALIDSKSPNPSIETLLHAFIPEKFIEHTHSTPFLYIANLKNSKKIINEIFGDKIAFVPYVKPGFDLAKLAAEIYDKNNHIDGLFLQHHGHFAWGQSAEEAYKKLIKQTNLVEKWILQNRHKNLDNINKTSPSVESKVNFLSKLRGELIKQNGQKNIIFNIITSAEISSFLDSPDAKKFLKRWVATPDHIIRTKGKPLFFQGSLEVLDEKNIFTQIQGYKNEYLRYFKEHSKNKNLTMLSPLPCLIWVKGIGIIGVGSSKKAAKIVTDIAQQTVSVYLECIKASTHFTSLPENDLFEMEYWSLEQAKLGSKKEKKLQGKVVLITGGAGEIGFETAKHFHMSGASVFLIDKNESLLQKRLQFFSEDASGMAIDITKKGSAKSAVNSCVLDFGGIDILISNAGIAIEGEILELESSEIRDSFEINYFTHLEFSKEAIKIMKKQQNGGKILFNISKQAMNPGIGFGAYGMPKLATFGLMRQLSIENGKFNIAVNGINADKIRSGLLNEDMIIKRAKARKLSKKAYMESNLLNSTVEASHVAEAFLALANLDRTTGHIITVDGGNVEASLR